MPHETVRTETTPEGETVVVRRRRSSHHRHHSHRHHRPGDGEAAQRRRQDLRFLAFALPLGLLAIGFLLWMAAVPRPGTPASSSNAGLLSLSWWMMLTGGAILAVALIVEWIRRGVESVRNDEEGEQTFPDGDGD